MAYRWDRGREDAVLPALLVHLSPREIQILELVRDDGTNDQIAATLGISVQTVKNHMTSIFEKLGVNSRTGAVIRSIRAGFLDLEPTGTPHPGARALLDAISATRIRMDKQLDELLMAIGRMRVS